MKNRTLLYSGMEFLHVNNGESARFSPPPPGVLEEFSFDLLLGSSEGLVTIDQDLGVKAEFRNEYGVFTLHLGTSTIAMCHLSWCEESDGEAWADVTAMYEEVHNTNPSWFPPLQKPEGTRWLAFMIFPGSHRIPKKAEKEIAAIALGLGFGIMNLRRIFQRSSLN